MKKILQRKEVHSMWRYTQTDTHTALNSRRNIPQRVGYKEGDVMSVMETVCHFTADPFLIQLFLT